MAGAADEVAHAKREMVATVQPLAKDAAVAVSRNGGNVIDAAVAAGLKSALRLQNVRCRVRDLSCCAAAEAKMKKQAEV